MTFGDVSLSVPPTEMDVFLVGSWLLQKMEVPDRCKPFLVSLFGMLQALLLEPVAVRQVLTVNEVTSGQWTRRLQPVMAGIHSNTVCNFMRWTSIMLCTGAACCLDAGGSGHKPVIGHLCPCLAVSLAMVTMAIPLSSFLFRLQPFFAERCQAE